MLQSGPFPPYARITALRPPPLATGHALYLEYLSTLSTWKNPRHSRLLLSENQASREMQIFFFITMKPSDMIFPVTSTWANAYAQLYADKDLDLGVNIHPSLEIRYRSQGKGLEA